MDSAHNDPASLRIPLMGAGALVIASIVFVALFRWSGMPIGTPDAPAIHTRALQFADRGDGGIDVIDANSNTLVETVTGEAGFIRGTLRGLARERRRAGVASSVPFDLVARADGRLTLVDPATGRRVDLESFGPTNAGQFARMLGDMPKGQ